MKKMKKNQMHSKFTFVSSCGWGLWDGFSWILRTKDETFLHVFSLPLFKWVVSSFKKIKYVIKLNVQKRKIQKLKINQIHWTSTLVLQYDVLNSNSST